MKQITIGYFDINMSFSNGLPFLFSYHGAHFFFMDKIQVMEVDQAVCALNSLSN